MIIALEIIGGLLALFLVAQILGRLARFVWIPILTTIIVGLIVGYSNHSLWGGIGAGVVVLIIFGISTAIVGGD
ncbi:MULTISPECIES: hypothetical protein [unclassified Bacteroides]|uniref:hypothetical protein n=1 Tax=unclassified Bacteroides TaxID=2646097 RepID=UPI00168BDD59|nr:MULTISPECIES: hypothetical protein [unclassified Bacteroides]MBD3592763.1 hypothetical protein [Bacteroides sp. GM023]